MSAGESDAESLPEPPEATVEAPPDRGSQVAEPPSSDAPSSHGPASVRPEENPPDESAGDELLRAPTRDFTRPPGRKDGLDAPDDDESAFDPVDPPEPVVSANATGIHTTAQPTPNAMASAPTRPTKPA